MFLNRKALAFLPLLVVHAFAQAITNATCATQFSWMNNGLGQSPCLVAAYLAGVCNNGSWFILSLDGAASYGAPAGELATPCECNTVFYNLIEACAACQGGTINQWQYWVQNCPQSYIAHIFPYPVPAGTQVPTWADIDPSAVGFWSPNIASAYAVGPSASITPGSTSPSPTSTVRPTTVYIQVSPTPTPIGKGGPTSSTPVGAIAGGVVGGVVLLIAIALGIWFLCIRPQRPQQQQQQQNDMRYSTVGGDRYSGMLPGGVFPGQMASTRSDSQATTAPLQQQPLYRVYPPSAQSPSAQNHSNPTFQPSSPSSNQDVPPLPDADPIRQSLYPQHIPHQSFAQSSSASPQSSPPLDPFRSSSFGAPGVQRGPSLAPSYRTTQYQ